MNYGLKQRYNLRRNCSDRTNVAYISYINSPKLRYRIFYSILCYKKCNHEGYNSLGSVLTAFVLLQMNNVKTYREKLVKIKKQMQRIYQRTKILKVTVTAL